MEQAASSGDAWFFGREAEQRVERVRRYRSRQERGAFGAALRRLRLRQKITQRELAQKNQQLNDIVQDQTRLRANLREMPTMAKAYKRYLEKFDQQESEIEKLQADLKKLEATQHTQQKALDDFLASFSAE